VRLLFTALTSVLLLTPVASRQLTAIRVSEGEDLQAALDRARPGDTILLARGARFVGNFVLPNAGEMPTFITIRTDAPGLPGPGTRTSPALSGVLAVLQSPDQTPVLRTARGAHHWRIENLEFRASGGNGDIIAFGDGGRQQQQLADVPRTLVLDRVYVHGDPRAGQKRGLSLNSGATQVINSYFADLKAIGQDAQAIAGWNGPGPYTIENNYLEASGENLLFGGADPAIDGLVPSDITIRRNDFSRPLAWREPMLGRPAGVRATVAQLGGTLAPGSYVYTVVAERPASGSPALSGGSEATPVQVSSNTAAVTLEWTAVPEAASYRVYRRSPSGSDVFFTTTTERFTDGGATGTAGSPRSATVWTVKNLLELKNARNVLIDGNVFEHNWAQAQNGYAVLFTPRNQDGLAPWSKVENVRFTNNIVRGVGAFLNAIGADDRNTSEQTRGLIIRNNLFIDLDGGKWGGSGDFVQIGNGPATVVIEHNTVSHTGRILSVFGGKQGNDITGLVFRDNVLRHNKYGVIGAAARPGQDTFDKFLPGAIFTGNVIAGGQPSSYPRGNAFVSEDDFAGLFVDMARGNYELQRGPYPGAGVNLRELEAAIGARTIAPAAPARSPQSSN
jgi:hypothetical protein